MAAPTKSTNVQKEDRRAMRANRKIRRANERWQPPDGWWRSRLPLLVALFPAVLVFSFVVLGVIDAILDPDGASQYVAWSLGGYLRGHGRLVGAAALLVTAIVFVRILALRDKSGLTYARLTGYVATLGLFDAASLAIAAFQN